MFQPDTFAPRINSHMNNSVLVILLLFYSLASPANNGGKISSIFSDDTGEYVNSRDYLESARGFFFKASYLFRYKGFKK